MADRNTNPYETPRSVVSGISVATRWRVIPAAGSFAIGLASFHFGMIAVAIMVYVVFTQNMNETIGGMLAGCTLYLGFGTTWMIAAWCYWRQKYLIWMAVSFLGILIPVVLISILGV